MTTSKTYDDLNRLTQISSQPSGTNVAPVSFKYSYNTANQRSQDTLADGSYWVYQYDSLGQVVSGRKYFYDHTPVPGQQFDYAFDTIGNRSQTKAGGDQNGGSQRLANYWVNNLNQITSRDYPGTNEIIGVALATNAVTVNNQTAFHKGEYFWGTVKTNNTTSPAWLTSTVSSGGSSRSGTLYMPQTPEQFSYDADGNLLSDGRWVYTWDAENRLMQMTVNTHTGPQYQLTFAYDTKGRRVQKIVATNNGTAYIGQYTNKFLYDGWNLIAILNSAFSLQPSAFFMWGSDLSGSMQGAGGVGGLLEVSDAGPSPANCFPAFDGNGNVVSLIDATNGTMAASYEYGPFGEVIRATGPMAKANPIRFSTEYCDDESDLLYYGNRYYKPSTGAWLSKEPKDEFGFETLESGVSEEDEIEPGGEWNPYRFVKNDAISRTDAFGLWPSASPWYGRLLNSGFAIPFTHENSDHRVLPLSASDMATVDAASVFVDNGQGTATSYQHAMRAPGQSRATAKTLANQWVTENLKAAQSLWCPCGQNVNRTVALWFFGTALHAVQDSTSPAHHGFQEWDGLSGWANELKAIAHVEKEEWDPGSGSNLDKATAWMWSFMRCPQPALPTDFFIWKADYSWRYD